MKRAWLTAALMLTAGYCGADDVIAKRLIRTDDSAPSLLGPKWSAHAEGFQHEGDVFICDNGASDTTVRGASQTVVLNQSTPLPIVASCWSKADNVGGPPNSDYSIYLDLVYTDGTHLYGQSAAFDTGTHDWQHQDVKVMPEKPIKSVSAYMLFRRHSGKAIFRRPLLQQLKVDQGAGQFDGLVVASTPELTGYAVRDVAANGDYLALGQDKAAGLELKRSSVRKGGATIHECQITGTTGKDRAITLVYTHRIAGPVQYLPVGRQPVATKAPLEYRDLEYSRRISRFPLVAVGSGSRGSAVGIDMTQPAIFRVGYSAATGELYIAYDIALTPEKPSASLRFFTLDFDAAWGIRGAVAGMYEAFPEQFACNLKKLGQWMPFYKISKVQGWEDFGFAFKEGNDETAWDDAHGILTFRYHEPMTWWMKMPAEMPRTMEAAVAEAQRLAQRGDARARTLLTSGFHDAQGQYVAKMLDTPWCNGAVWSMNSMPGIPGGDFATHWNPKLKDKLYGTARKGDLDGEYVDSIEGYVTADLDFRREHFSAAKTPLTFDGRTHRPAIHKGLVVFESTKAIADDVHAIGKYMMANGAGRRFCWLVPPVDVHGTETDWHRKGAWRPMKDEDLLQVRMLCGKKPYCFLMNTHFDQFPPELVEKYMKRSLAYGMFPGFFSHNASEKQYFSQPELYERDRPLFKKYVPLCKLVAEAGWQPVTLARCSDEKVYVERWGEKYLTIFNDSPQQRTITLMLEGLGATSARELLSKGSVSFSGAKAQIRLDGEDVAVLELQ